MAVLMSLWKLPGTFLTTMGLTQATAEHRIQVECHLSQGIFHVSYLAKLPDGVLFGECNWSASSEGRQIEPLKKSSDSIYDNCIWHEFSYKCLTS